MKLEKDRLVAKVDNLNQTINQSNEDAVADGVTSMHSQATKSPVKKNIK